MRKSRRDGPEPLGPRGACLGNLPYPGGLEEAAPSSFRVGPSLLIILIVGDCKSAFAGEQQRSGIRAAKIETGQGVDLFSSLKSHPRLALRSVARRRLHRREGAATVPQEACRGSPGQ